jgi:hypothetical protein
MGGLVFASDGLSTPRMPPRVYHAALVKVEELLRAHYKVVGHALEAPAKTSYGDLDVLVAEPAGRQISQGQATGKFLAGLLAAKTWKRMSGSSTYHVALPWPEEFQDAVSESICTQHTVSLSDLLDVSDTTERANEATNPTSAIDLQLPSAISSETNPRPVKCPCQLSALPSESYIQVDINIMPTLAYFNWHMFYQAHGDLWNMLGGIIRRFGFTVSTKGLSLRIAEVEKHNKEQARVLATSDPNTVLEYMGLDKERYWRHFDSWDDMLAYAASCRFHNPARWKLRDRHQEDDDADSKPDGAKEAEAGERSIVKLLKHNDRQRAAKRPLFGYWIETYLPEHVDDAPGKSAHLTREEVLEDAKQFFGPEFAQKFEDRRTKMVRQIGMDKLWADIRKGLPVEGTEIGYIMKGMKLFLAGQHGNATSDESLNGLQDARKAFEETRFDDVLEWARVNWKEVGNRQKKLNQEQSRAHFREKLQREELKRPYGEASSA